MLCRQKADFARSRIITKMPRSHIPNSAHPMSGEALLLTESVKSFSQWEAGRRFMLTALVKGFPASAQKERLRLSAHKRRRESLIGTALKGTKGLPVVPAGESR